MAKLLVLVGLPASGKSTYAKSLGRLWLRVNYDQMRWYAVDGTPIDYKFSRQNEEAIKQSAEKITRDALLRGFDVVVDNTNLTAQVQGYWGRLAAECGAEFETLSFNTFLDECLRRNKERVGWARVPRAVIERMALTSGRIQWPVGRRAVIVDIDGTLANGDHRKKYVSGACMACDGSGQDEQSRANNAGVDILKYSNPPDCRYCEGTGKAKKDWDKYFSLLSLDTPVKAVVEWIKSLKDQGFYVVIVSGRGAEAATARGTEDWLEKYEIPYDRLFMRKAGDRREDSIIKKEILDAIKPNIEVAFAIDDRPRVIRMWRENGIKTYDVGEGIEF